MIEGNDGLLDGSVAASRKDLTGIWVRNLGVSEQLGLMLTFGKSWQHRDW